MICHAAAGGRVADVMIRFPKTHGCGSRLEQIRAFFEDDHLHMALIVAMHGRLVTTIERSDLVTAMSAFTPATELGTLTGRTTGPTDPLDAATLTMLRGRRRRLAVVDDSGQLRGLLCLKKDETGYCSDEGIRERGHQARRTRTGSMSCAPESAVAEDKAAMPHRAGQLVALTSYPRRG